jgi:hypothetical protein
MEWAKLPVAERSEIVFGCHKTFEDTTGWNAHDPRLCKKCEPGRAVWILANRCRSVWKCGDCGIKTAERWDPRLATWSHGQIVQNADNCGCKYHRTKAKKEQDWTNNEIPETETGLAERVLVSDFDEDDPRWCHTSPPNGREMLLSKNSDCNVWRCGSCQRTTAKQWMPWSANYRGGEIEKLGAACMMAVITAKDKKESLPATT